MPIDRRHFIQGTAGFLAAAAVGCSVRGTDGASGSNPSGTTITTLGASSAGTSGAGTLVVITLAGGNDALNTVAPVGTTAYAAQRGPLALDPATTLDVGEGFGLHPSLTRSKALWDEGRLAIVHGVGFDALDRSHFHCADVWSAGDERQLTSGWLGRWLDRAGDDPLTAVAVGRRLPLLLRGELAAGAVVPAGSFALPGGDEVRAMVEGLSQSDPERAPLARAAAQADRDLLSVVDRVQPVTAGLAAGDDLAARMATIASLIEADLPTRVCATELGGFDTHANQLTIHEGLLGELDAALGDLLDRVADRPVTVLVHTEFGRRVAANASGGTDHGKGGTVLVAGSVRGGHYGDPPPLDRLVDGDLATTVDFRAIYASLLEGVLEVDAGDVLPTSPEPLPLI